MTLNPNLPAVSELPLDCRSLPKEASGQLPLPFKLKGSQAKTAYALRKNCEDMLAGHTKRTLQDFRYVGQDGKETTVKHYVAKQPQNLDCAGFLTLTVGDYVCLKHGVQLPKKDGRDEWTNRCPCCDFPMAFEQVKSAEEANRRFNNINRALLKLVFEKAVVVTERHKSNAVHFHLVGLLAGRPDIRTGVNFAAIAKRDYRSAGETLRGLWAVLRQKLPEFGFGRAELLPIRSTGEAVACYVSKYVEKNLFNRTKDDYRKKLVRYIGFRHRPSTDEQRDFFRMTGKVPKTIAEQLRPNDFSWGTKRACAWRAKARETAALIGVNSREQCGEAFGPRWAMKLSQTWQGRTVDDVSPWLVEGVGKNNPDGSPVVKPIEWGTKRLLANDLSKLVCPNWLSENERRFEPVLTQEEAFDWLGRETQAKGFNRVTVSDYDAELDESVAGLIAWLKKEKADRLAKIAGASLNDGTQRGRGADAPIATDAQSRPSLK